MLESKTVKKIEDFVAQKPRSLFEVANHLGVSWRTCDRYVDHIAKEFGSIATRTFREGTRGALKIVYCSDSATFKSSIFQEQLEKDILTSKKKEDFSAFDIFQHIADSKKQAIIAKSYLDEGLEQSNLLEFISQAKHQVIIFSGNLSFINLKNNKGDFLRVVDSAVKRKVTFKIVCRVDLASRENIEKILSLNHKYGVELVEVRHSQQPVRAVIVDGKVVSLKEIKEPTGKINELNKRVFIYYIIKDKEWIEWLTRVFWKLFSNSIDSNKRLAELKKLKFNG